MIQAAAVMTGIVDARGRTIKTLPIAVRQALMAADSVLRLHGMQFELLCEDCWKRDGGPEKATVAAIHGPDGSLSEMVCRCTRRRFQAPF